jgi:hypothetical protein
MSANLEQAILKKLQALPDGKQQEVLALVEALLDKEQLAQPDQRAGQSAKSLRS